MGRGWGVVEGFGTVFGILRCRYLGSIGSLAFSGWGLEFSFLGSIVDLLRGVR